MKVLCLIVLAIAAVVSTVSAQCPTCDDKFKGFGTEPGKCGCCPWPCCCKCVETNDCPPPVITTTTEEPDCPCLDLAFVVDASGSIGTFDWKITLDFLQDIVLVLNEQRADRCPDSLNVAVVTFSNNGTVQIPLTNSDVIDINPTTVPQDAQLTNIVEGIEVALDEVFSDERTCKRFVVMLTDGRSNFRVDDIKMMGDRLEAEVDDAVCIGITNKIDASQLKDLCPLSSHRMSVNDFNELIQLVSDQVSGLLMDTMTTAEVPEPEPCKKKEECFCCCSPEQFWGGYRR